MPITRHTWTARSVIMLGLTAVAVALLLGAMALYLADNGDRVRLGDNQFGDLQAERTANASRAADRSSSPTSAAAPGWSTCPTSVTTRRPVGTSSTPGHRARARDCILDWNHERAVRRPLDTANTYPIDGTGLRQYPVTVNDKGRLIIDFNADPASTTTTTAAR